MRKLIIAGAMFAGLSGLAMAESWTGALLDEGCAHHKNTTKTCIAKPSSSAYVLDVSGHQYKFDGKSNDEIRRALESRRDRSADHHELKSEPVNVNVTGRVADSGHIHVEKIEIQ
jgi:hypothetical protein